MSTTAFEVVKLIFNFSVTGHSNLVCHAYCSPLHVVITDGSNYVVKRYKVVSRIVGIVCFRKEAVHICYDRQ
jgi:hypothetical protein